MQASILKGTTFGLTSGIITTLGLINGLYAGTMSRSVVLGGIITIAVADALSDALGIHISEESENQHTEKEIWAATLCTFASKLVFALTFVVPVLLLELGTAVIVSIIWGFSVIAILSFFMARWQKKSAFHVVGEHLVITAVVVVATHYIGLIIASYFG